MGIIVQNLIFSCHNSRETIVADNVDRYLYCGRVNVKNLYNVVVTRDAVADIFLYTWCGCALLLMVVVGSKVA